MLRTFIQVLALALSLMSAYFLIKGVMQLTVNDVSKLSSTYFGYNLAMARSYCQQRADYIVGFVLLLLGAILQGVNLMWAMRFCDFDVNKKGAMAAAIVAVVIFMAACNISRYIYNTCYNQVEHELKKDE